MNGVAGGARVIDHRRLRAIAADLFAAAASSQTEAVVVADHLVDANLKGHDSHGIIRAPKYVAWVGQGALIPNRHARLASDNGVLLVIDGGFGYGKVVGREAMAMAAERALKNGLCAVALRNSGHLGRIGAWPEQLALAGLASVHFVNTSGYGILVAPHGGSDRRLSANPIAAGCPGPDGHPIILDIATSVIAEGKIQIARNRGESLKPGLVMNSKGRPTTDPKEFYASPPGAILPMAGHKGSGLSFICEVLAGSLTGGGSSHPQSPTAWRLVNNMLSIAFNPAAVGDADFAADLGRLASWVSSSPPLEPGGRVLLPGEIEHRTESERRRDGIPFDAETARQLHDAMARLRLEIPPELRA